MKPQNEQIKARKVAGFFENILKNAGTIALGAVLFAMIFLGYYLISDSVQKREIKYAAELKFSVRYADKNADKISLDKMEEIMTGDKVKDIVLESVSTDESYSDFIEKATIDYSDSIFTLSYFDDDETYATTVVKSIYTAISTELMSDYDVTNTPYKDEANPIIFKVSVKTGGFVNSLGIKGFTVLGLVIGILFSLAGVCALYLLDNTVKNAMDVRRYYDLPVLAVIPTVKDKDEEEL